MIKTMLHKVTFYIESIFKKLKSHYTQFIEYVFSIFQSRFDTIFIIGGILFLSALCYEILIRYVFPYYTFTRVSILFSVIFIIFVWKAILEKNQKVIYYQKLLETHIVEIFYAYLIIGIILLFWSLYIPFLDNNIHYLFYGGVLLYALFKYFWNSLEFKKIEITEKFGDTIKKIIIFICFSIVVFLPFVYTVYLYQYKVFVLVVLVLLELFLLAFLIIDRVPLRKRNIFFKHIISRFTLFK